MSKSKISLGWFVALIFVLMGVMGYLFSNMHLSVNGEEVHGLAKLSYGSAGLAMGIVALMIAVIICLLVFLGGAIGAIFFAAFILLLILLVAAPVAAPLVILILYCARKYHHHLRKTLDGDRTDMIEIEKPKADKSI